MNMILNDETWFLVRETGGIGDFTGSGGKPSPMLPQDVKKLLNKGEEKAEETPKLKINFKKGDRVKINEGPSKTLRVKSNRLTRQTVGSQSC